MEVRLDRLLDEDQLRRQLAADVRAGLARSPKAVRSRWVWDAHASALFDRIVESPSYDLPRRERGILERHAGTIASVRPETVLELGSGSSPRSSLLLDELVPSGLGRFVAMDVSEDALRGALPRLAERYPGLDVRAVVGDFERQLALVETPGRTLVLLLGSTIGALEPCERAALLREIARRLRTGDDALLLGVDLVKPEAEVLAAYAHPDGLAGGLIANLLPIVNRELGADFDPGRFQPESTWNAGEERLETVVRSLEQQVVTVPALAMTLELAAGETIRTQVSAKFRREGMEAELAAAGLRLDAWWTDPGDGFAVVLARSNHPG
jgi:L-histidine N-alpha-methyltransferase